MQWSEPGRAPGTSISKHAKITQVARSTTTGLMASEKGSQCLVQPNPAKPRLSSRVILRSPGLPCASLNEHHREFEAFLSEWNQRDHFTARRGREADAEVTAETAHVTPATEMTTAAALWSHMAASDPIQQVVPLS